MGQSPAGPLSDKRFHRQETVNAVSPDTIPRAPGRRPAQFNSLGRRLRSARARKPDNKLSFWRKQPFQKPAFHLLTEPRILDIRLSGIVPHRPKSNERGSVPASAKATTLWYEYFLRMSESKSSEFCCSCCRGICRQRQRRHRKTSILPGRFSVLKIITLLRYLRRLQQRSYGVFHPVAGTTVWCHRGRS